MQRKNQEYYIGEENTHVLVLFNLSIRIIFPHKEYETVNNNLNSHNILDIVRSTRSKII